MIARAMPGCNLIGGKQVATVPLVVRSIGGLVVMQVMQQHLPKIIMHEVWVGVIS